MLTLKLRLGKNALVFMSLRDYGTGELLESFPASTIIHSDGDKKYVNISDTLLAANMASPVKREWFFIV